MRNSKEEVKEALKHRIDLLEDVDYGNHTPLICAAVAEKYENVQLLLEFGANVNAIDNSDETALIKIADRGTIEATLIVKMLIEKGANIELKNKMQKTALMYVCGADLSTYRNGNLESLKLLLEAGADVNIKDRDGFAAIDYAIKRNERSDIIQYLQSYSK